MPEATTRWALRGRGYEYCNCNFGCGCNFAGFPSSKDGSCRALVGHDILEGRCGDVDLSGVKCAAVVHWPKAIHEGGGKAVFVVAPSTTDQQIDALAQIFSGKLGGMPWEILGTTFEVAGLVKAPISIEGEGRRSTYRIEGIGEGRGEPFRNPVTGEEHEADVVLSKGFIWNRGQCGAGTFNVSAADVSIASENSNWIYYEFDWANA